MARKRKKFFKTFSRFLLNPKVIALIGLCILIFISTPLVRNLDKRYKVNEEIKELKKEIAEIEENNLDLDKMIGYLESDQFTEEQARLNFGLKKEGESIAVIQFEDQPAENKASGSLDKEVKTAEENNLTNPQRWKRYFFKIFK